MSNRDQIHASSDPVEVMRKIEGYFAATPAQQVIDRLHELMPDERELATEDPSLSQLAGELAWSLRDGIDLTVAAFGKAAALALLLLDRLQASRSFLSDEQEVVPQYLSSSVRHMLVARRYNVGPTLDRLVGSSWYRDTQNELQSVIADRVMPSEDTLRDYRAEFSALASLLAEAAL